MTFRTVFKTLTSFEVSIYNQFDYRKLIKIIDQLYLKIMVEISLIMVDINIILLPSKIVRIIINFVEDRKKYGECKFTAPLE